MARRRLGLLHGLMPAAASLILLALVVAPGLASYRVAVAGEPAIDWIRQFGSTGNDMVGGVAADSSGIYVVGRIADQSFLRKYNTNGDVVWSRDGGNCVAVDYSGIYVAGWSSIRKYDANGNEMWACDMDDEGYHCGVTGISVESGGIYVAGTLWSIVSGDHCGGFVRKYDANGNQGWTRNLGPYEFTVNAFPSGVSADSTGIHVSWDANDIEGNDDGFVRRYDANGNEVWLRQLGLFDPYLNSTSVISADATGIYVGGAHVRLQVLRCRHLSPQVRC